MNTTEIKCLQLQRISLLPEIQDVIKSFAFRDIHIDQMRHKHNMKDVLQTIDECYSRKNGFRNQKHPSATHSDDSVVEGFQPSDQEDVPDSDVEHWFIAPLCTNDFAMQAINCSQCGNYLMTHTYELFFALSPCSTCTCDRLLIG